MGLLYKSFKLLNIILGECNFLPTILVEFIKVCALLNSFVQVCILLVFPVKPIVTMPMVSTNSSSHCIE